MERSLSLDDPNIGCAGDKLAIFKRFNGVLTGNIGGRISGSCEKSS